MIRVTVELLPLGSEAHKRQLALAEIWNDGTGDAETGNYRFQLTETGPLGRMSASGAVTDFPRLEQSAWELVYRVLGVIARRISAGDSMHNRL